MSQLVFLVRHATADYKPGRLYGWTPGVHLSSLGRDQAKQLAERLEPVRFTAIYSSPLERCVETAEAVAGGRGLTVNTVQEIGEVRYGSWERRSFKQVMKTKLWKTIQSAPSQAVFPGGESIRELQRRGVEAIEEIRTRHKNGCIAVFSHADMIKAMAVNYLGMHLDLFQRIVIDPASVTVIGFSGHHVRVLRVGDSGSFEGFRPPVRS